MKKPALLVVLLVLFGVVLWQGSQYFFIHTQNNMLMSQSDLSEVILEFEPSNQRLRVTLAKTEASRAVGLGGKSQLSNDGMLFLFPARDRWQFWMKGMQFGLDFVWIQDGRIVGITPDVPAPDPLSDRPYGEVVFWKTPVNLILELPAGRAAALGLEVGDAVVPLSIPE